MAEQLAHDPESERALELGPPGLNHHHPCCLGLRPCAREERRLAKPGRAFHVSQTPVAEARPLNEGIDPFKLTVPLEDAGTAVSSRGRRAGCLHQTTLN